MYAGRVARSSRPQQISRHQSFRIATPVDYLQSEPRGRPGNRAVPPGNRKRPSRSPWKTKANEMNDLDSNAQEPVNEDAQIELSDLDQKVPKPAWASRFMQRWQAPHTRQRLRKVSNASLALVVLLVIALLSGNSFFSLLANQVRAGFGLFQYTAPRSNPSSLLSVSTPLTHVHGQDGIACLLDS